MFYYELLKNITTKSNQINVVYFILNGLNYFFEKVIIKSNQNIILKTKVYHNKTVTF